VQRALRIFLPVVIRDGSVVAVVLAGGSGTRVGADGNKAYIPLAGRSLASWSLNAFGWLPPVGRRLLVIRPEDREVAEEVIDRELDDPSVEVIEGGTTRHSSEWAALTYLREDIDRGKVDLVLIHDAARPLVTRTLVQAVIQTAAVSGGAMPGIFDDELGLVDDYGHLQPALPPGAGNLVRTQTPQGFLAKPLLSAYELAKADGFEGTDTASTMLRYSDVKIRPVPGDTRNLKITYPQDLFTAEDILSEAQYDLT
jgi:2-C-methyl-D-erythritol 4-phosphate cytidylyltransferase